jgi:hypothetical protein
MENTVTLDPQEILKIVKETPNDVELGGKIRTYIYAVEETR